MTKSPITLAIDIGGTGIKMMTLDSKAKAITERTKLPTPRPATPETMLETMVCLLRDHPEYDRVSVGFPGVVKNGIVITAPNLDPAWENIHLNQCIEQLTGKPARSANDADIQGLGNIQGSGVELAITLGTGMGSALFVDGALVPNLELGHHPFKGKKTYEDYLGIKAFKKEGHKTWQHRVKEAVQLLEKIFNFEFLYIGGGNSKEIKCKLPGNVRITQNIAGLLGGIRLWDARK